jgi:hypothetical protein
MDKVRNPVILSVSMWSLQIVFRFFAPAVAGKGPPCCNGNAVFRWGCWDEVFCLVSNHCLRLLRSHLVLLYGHVMGNIAIWVASQCYMCFGDFLGRQPAPSDYVVWFSVCTNQSCRSYSSSGVTNANLCY